MMGSFIIYCLTRKQKTLFVLLVESLQFNFFSEVGGSELN